MKEEKSLQTIFRETVYEAIPRQIFHQLQSEINRHDRLLKMISHIPDVVVDNTYLCSSGAWVDWYMPLNFALEEQIIDLFTAEGWVVSSRTTNAKSGYKEVQFSYELSLVETAYLTVTFSDTRDGSTCKRISRTVLKEVEEFELVCADQSEDTGGNNAPQPESKEPETPISND